MDQSHEAPDVARACAIARICVEMIKQEDKADVEAESYFKELLDDAFCFRRANGTTVGKEEFIASLAKGAGAGRKPGGEVDVAHYEGMAVASLRVVVEEKAYRNLRIFVRGGRQGWRLQMWCNQGIT